MFKLFIVTECYKQISETIRSTFKSLCNKSFPQKKKKKRTEENKDAHGPHHSFEKEGIVHVGSSRSKNHALSPYREKRVEIIVCSNLNPLHPRMLCVKFS